MSELFQQYETKAIELFGLNAIILRLGACLFRNSLHCYPQAILNKGLDFKQTYFTDALKNLHPQYSKNLKMVK